jgi:hypothetical protein
MGIFFVNKNIILVYLTKRGVKIHRKEGLNMNKEEVKNPNPQPTNPQPTNPDTNPDTTTTK